MYIREMNIEFYRHYCNVLEVGPAWQYDESRACGVNYNSIIQAWIYDRGHQKFRDYKKESKQIISLLGLKAEQTVIDMGCGTGAFAVNAAEHCRKVYAVDVSKAMLSCARRKARKARLNNIQFENGGFLTYKHKAEPADAIVSTMSLHHLPDFWKLIGLRRLAKMLKTNGKLFIFDLVFAFDPAKYKSCLSKWVASAGEKAGYRFEVEAQIHLREEYSTFDWVMEGLLERAGFKIQKAEYKEDLMATYLCVKKAD
ncbi:MAG: class I SAM-dependent methyltransferase [Planctomycetota bacterium]|jgi:ubiquinone/menaquinone biosynthesis C-methylase UbiE